MEIRIEPARSFEGTPEIPGDKSVSHRAQLFGALAIGRSEIIGLSGGEDVISTRRCLSALGVEFETKGKSLLIDGVGLRGFKAPSASLDCGNSGSTIRMLMGILAGQSFKSVLVGDESLSRRPMGRVAEPLAQMGAKISMSNKSFTPVTVEGVGELKSMNYALKVASAQVKSAILFAALYAKGETTLSGEILSRDHTERLLPFFGAEISVSPQKISLQGGQTLKATKVEVASDPSSAAFWWAAACVVKGARVRTQNVLLNPTRVGFLRVLERMGAKVTEQVIAREPELVGEVEVQQASLKGVTISKEEVASLIDELPMLAVLAAYAEGATIVRGAEELRVKETDRIAAIAVNFKAMGGEIEVFEDGFRIKGPQKLKGAKVDSLGDHRIAMAFAVGALGATGSTLIQNAESVNISYPNFFETLQRLSRG